VRYPRRMVLLRRGWVASRRTAPVALVAVLGAIAPAAAQPPARGPIQLAVGASAWHLWSYNGGTETRRDLAVGGGLGWAVRPELTLGLGVEHAVDQPETQGQTYLSGLVRARLPRGLLVTAELVTGRIHVAHRGDYTVLGGGARLGYAVALDRGVELHGWVGGRWFATFEDASSYEAPSMPAIALGLDVLWSP
jgi:hypothetical protein